MGVAWAGPAYHRLDRVWFVMNKLKPFAIEYRHNGRLYHIEVHAEDFDDAKARIRSAHYNGKPLQLVATAKVPSWLQKLIG